MREKSKKRWGYGNHQEKTRSEWCSEGDTEENGVPLGSPCEFLPIHLSPVWLVVQCNWAIIFPGRGCHVREKGKLKTKIETKVGQVEGGKKKRKHEKRWDYEGSQEMEKRNSGREQNVMPPWSLCGLPAFVQYFKYFNEKNAGMPYKACTDA